LKEGVKHQNRHSESSNLLEDSLYRFTNIRGRYISLGWTSFLLWCQPLYTIPGKSLSGVERV